MGFIAGIIGFVVMICVINYIIKQAEKKEAVKQEISNPKVFVDGQIIELDKEIPKHGDVFCKNCRHLIQNMYYGGRMECRHKDAYVNVGVNVITGEPLVQRMEDWNIYLKWNKNCDCPRFEARGK